MSNEEGVNVFQSFADTPSYIFLGHEMIHALHHMNGTKGTSASWRYYRDNQGNIKKESLGMHQSKDDFETVGLYYISPIQNPAIHKKINPPYYTPANYRHITENTLRRENGLMLRAAYTVFGG